MSLSTEQVHMRFLAIVLPCLTFCTHSLLALSFILPGSDLDHAYLSVAYNVLACCASILGLVGAVRSLPSLVSAYTLVHTMTLSFATLALVNIVLPWNFRVLNPVTPSYAVDESSLCRDIDAGFGWDTEWLQKCSRGLAIIKFGGAGVGMLLMLAQWWALLSVRTWGQELRSQRHRAQQGDVEKAGLVSGADTTTYDEKTGL